MPDGKESSWPGWNRIATRVAKTKTDLLPARDEVEVSLFGPGTGEALAVHLGGGDWMTIDSCVERTSGNHALLGYFESIGVDVARDVRLVVGTHAHDDHLAGIGELFERASGAQFVTSVAQTAEEFLAEVEADQDIKDELRIGVRDEYRRIMAEVRRRPYSRYQRSPILHAGERDRLFHRPEKDGVPAATVTALSPSDVAQLRAKTFFAQGVSQVGKRKRLKATDPNEIAVAVLVEVGAVVMLFGADLTTGPAGCGWRRIDDFASELPKSSLFKVPHHGSKNAHYEKTWTNLLAANPVALLAPFLGGGSQVPSRSEKQAILARTDRAHIVASTTKRPQPKTVMEAAEAFIDIAIAVYEPFGKLGHLRARRQVDAEGWTVSATKPAHALRVDS